MNSIQKHLSNGFIGVALLASVGCDSGPDPAILEPYETIQKERIALREEIIEALLTIKDEASADDAIGWVVEIREKQKQKREENDALGPRPKDVNNYLYKKYKDQLKDLKQREDDTARAVSSVAGTANFFREVPFFIFTPR